MEGTLTLFATRTGVGESTGINPHGERSRVRGPQESGYQEQFVPLLARLRVEAANDRFEQLAVTDVVPHFARIEEVAAKVGAMERVVAVSDPTVERGAASPTGSPGQGPRERTWSALD